jgi:tRNA (cmo5U34)-methyltransferase
MAEQYHFDPTTYLAMIREEVPDYDTLQTEIERAVRESNATGTPRVLDLGGGTGTTSRAVLDARPGARLVLVDENPDMLDVARETLPAGNVEGFVVADLSDLLPAGPFELVVSALAVHHLDPGQKRALFTSVRDRLTGRGRFALADVVVPEDPADAVTPLSPGYDQPDTAADVLAWLRDAGFRADIVWSRRDLAVFVADKGPADAS